MENPNLTKQIIPNESELKDIIVNYVGKSLNPDTDEVTVEDIIKIFAEQFPEFLLSVAEENWINGYTQALNDLQYSQKISEDKNDTEKLHTEQ